MERIDSQMLARKPWLLRIYLFLGAMEGFLSLFRLASIPSDSRNAIFLGYSSSRLILLGGILSISILLVFLLAWLTLSNPAVQRIVSSLDRLLNERQLQVALVVIAGILLISGIGFLLMPESRWGGTVEQARRLAPPMMWVTAMAAQTLIGQFFWLGGKIRWMRLSPWRQSLKLSALVAGILLGTSAALLISRLGIQPDRSGWYAPGTPILFMQVILAVMAGLGLIHFDGKIKEWFGGRERKIGTFAGLDFLPCFLLWFAALLTWWLEPLKDFSYFAPPPTPPNYESYPYSDAAIYDGSAQSILIGAGRETGLMLRPLYAFFLAILHLLTNQKYETLIFLQICALAFIPVLIFLIASRLGSRAAGLTAGIMLILREKNSIALTNVIEVSHSKLLLSDMPTLALVLLFVYVFLAWLQNRDQIHKGILTGGTLGLVILIRSQALLLIPVIIGMIVVAEWRQVKKVFHGSSLFLLGVLLTISPWIWRNYQVSGRMVVENTEYYIGFIASGYADSVDEIRRLPGETSADYYDRMKLQIITFTKARPKEVAHFYASHFIHNEIESVIYLPLSFGLYDLRSYVNKMAFWDEPFGNLSIESALLLILNMGLFALGLGTALYRNGLAGVAPLLIHFGYNLSIVPTRMSGWRLIMPVDWVPLLYYSIGLIQFGKMAVAVLFSNKIEGDLSESRRKIADTAFVGKFNLKRAAIFSVVFLVIGLSLPLLERLIPLRYPKVNSKQLLQKIPLQGLELDDGSRALPSEIQSFLDSQNNGVILYGRALYPSYYQRGDYWGDENAFNLIVREYDRLQFRLIGPERTSVYIPMQSSPEYFPHAADVLIIGCKDDKSNSIQSLVVVVDSRTVINASPWTGLSCSTAK